MDALNLGTFIGSTLFLLAAIILFSFGFIRTRKFRHWKRVEGEIVDRSTKISLGTPKPTVHYIVKGKEYENTSSIGQRAMPRPGKKVGVFYNPHHPEQAIMDTFIQRGDFFKMMGILFFLVALAIIFLPLLSRSIFQLNFKNKRS